MHLHENVGVQRTKYEQRILRFFFSSVHPPHPRTKQRKSEIYTTFLKVRQAGIVLILRSVPECRTNDCPTSSRRGTFRLLPDTGVRGTQT